VGLHRRQWPHHQLLADINITPLVDVVLVLLVIFMVTAPSCNPESMSVFQKRAPQEISEERLVISIDKQQRVFLGNDAINIKPKSAPAPPKIRRSPQLLRLRPCRRKCPFGAFATVMGCRQAVRHWQCKHRGRNP